MINWSDCKNVLKLLKFIYNRSSWIQEYLSIEFRTIREILNRYIHVQLKDRSRHAKIMILLVSCFGHFKNCSKTRFQSMFLCFENCARSLKSVFDQSDQFINWLHIISHTRAIYASLSRKIRLNRLILLFE